MPGAHGQEGGSSAALAPPESPPPTEAQEEEITENLMNIQKMQKTQVKCRKVSREGGTLCKLGIWDSAGLHLQTGARRAMF